MSKKTIICTIMALSLILVGTGYAYWTDSLNITTTATTGDLDVTFADLGLYAQYGNEHGQNNWSIVDGIGEDGFVGANYFKRDNSNYNIIASRGSIDNYYKRAESYNSIRFDAQLVETTPLKKDVGPYPACLTNGSDNIKLLVSGMYPGYAQAFRTEIINQGSIAAKLSKINFALEAANCYTITDATKDMLGIALLVEREYSATATEHGTGVFELCKSNLIGEGDIFEVGGVQFARLSALEDLSPEAYKEYSSLLAVPSENRMDLYIAIAMDPDADGVYTTGSTADIKNNDDARSQYKGVQISIDLLWDQFNEGKVIDSTNILEHQNK